MWRSTETPSERRWTETLKWGKNPSLVLFSNLPHQPWPTKRKEKWTSLKTSFTIFPADDYSADWSLQMHGPPIHWAVVPTKPWPSHSLYLLLLPAASWRSWGKPARGWIGWNCTLRPRVSLWLWTEGKVFVTYLISNAKSSGTVISRPRSTLGRKSDDQVTCYEKPLERTDEIKGWGVSWVCSIGFP